MPKVELKRKGLQMDLAAKEAINVGVREASKQIQGKLKWGLDTSMRSLWSYKGESRDIVDEGDLKKSLTLNTSTMGSKTTIKIGYSMPYAKLIYYGGYITPYGNKNAADVLVPGRPWVQAILYGTHGQKKVDLKTPTQRSIKRAWNQRFKLTPSAKK